MTTEAAAREGGPMLLGGDVGGTKTSLAVLSAAGGPCETLAKPSAAYRGLAEMAKAFLGDLGLRVQALCVDVAGPVIDGQPRLTNLDCRLDERSTAAHLGRLRTWLITDLVATASAIPHLRGKEVLQVKEGKARREDPIAVPAPGTGLGEAFLTRQGAVIPGGPAAYAPHQSDGASRDTPETDSAGSFGVVAARQPRGRIEDGLLTDLNACQSWEMTRWSMSTTTRW